MLDIILKSGDLIKKFLKKGFLKSFLLKEISKLLCNVLFFLLKDKNFRRKKIFL